MTLLNKNEHLSCSNYANEHTRIFSFISLKKGEIVERKRFDTTFLVFIIEGRMEVRYDGEKHVEALPGKVFLLPGGKLPSVWRRKIHSCCFVLFPIP